MTELTKEEIDAIKADAEKEYPGTYVFNGVRFDDLQSFRKKDAYVAGATSERIKAKELAETLQWLRNNIVMIAISQLMQEDAKDKIDEALLNYKP